MTLGRFVREYANIVRCAQPFFQPTFMLETEHIVATEGLAVNPFPALKIPNIDAYFVLLGVLQNVSLPTASRLPHASVAVRITNHQLFRRDEDYLYERDYFRSLVGLPVVRGMLRAYGRGGCRSAGLLQDGRG